MPTRPPGTRLRANIYKARAKSGNSPFRDPQAPPYAVRQRNHVLVLFMAHGPVLICTGKGPSEGLRHALHGHRKPSVLKHEFMHTTRHVASEFDFQSCRSSPHLLGCYNNHGCHRRSGRDSALSHVQEIHLESSVTVRATTTTTSTTTRQKTSRGTTTVHGVMGDDVKNNSLTPREDWVRHWASGGRVGGGVW